LKPKKIKTTDLVVMAFLMTIEIILTRFFRIQTPVVRIGFGFLPMSIMAILYGPFWAGLTYAACDLIGMMLLPAGAFFPGFTLTALLTGLIYGFAFHNKTITWVRVLAVSVVIGIFCNLILDTIWVYMLYGQALRVLLPMRLIRVGITIPLQTILISFVWRRCASMFARLTNKPEAHKAC
jgi:ECF transporter S component (folate family)